MPRDRQPRGTVRVVTTETRRDGVVTETVRTEPLVPKTVSNATGRRR